VTLQLTLQGGLIYAAMVAYLAGFSLALLTARRAARALFGAGFLIAVAAVVYRGVQAGHVPLRNLFDVFLVLGMLMYPLSLGARRLAGIGGEAADMLIAAVLLFPAGFVLDGQPAPLPPVLQSPFFVPHVLAYMVAYAVLAKASVQAAMALVRGPAGRPAANRSGAVPPSSPSGLGVRPAGDAARALTRLAFPALTAGLVLGALWGKQAWGDWWNWDPKELSSLAAWLVFVAALHVRPVLGGRGGRLEAGLILLGMGLNVLTLIWVNLSTALVGLHSYA